MMISSYQLGAVAGCNRSILLERTMCMLLCALALFLGRLREFLALYNMVQYTTGDEGGGVRES